MCECVSVCVCVFVLDRTTKEKKHLKINPPIILGRRDIDLQKPLASVYLNRQFNLGSLIFY